MHIQRMYVIAIHFDDTFQQAVIDSEDDSQLRTSIDLQTAEFKIIEQADREVRRT